MSKYLVSLSCVLGLCVVACGSSEPEPTEDEGRFPPPEDGYGFQMKYETVAPAGTEIWKCMVYDLPNQEWEPVNRVESFQTEGMHHMDVMALAFANVEIEPGEYDCEALYDQYWELMEDGVIIMAAQQAEQTIQLPAGTVANLPPSLRVMQEIHYVNTSDEDVEVYSYVNAYNIHPTEVEQTIWGNVVRDVNIHVPAKGNATEWTRCVMTDDIDLLFLSSHTHQWARKVTVRTFDGDQVGEEIYTNTDWQTPFLESWDTEPLHLAAGTGIEFACDFENPTGDDVAWGFGAADEMCQVAMVFTPGEANRVCKPVDSSDGLHDEPPVSD